LRLIISRQEQTKAKLYLEVNDYIESKDQKLLSFIQSKINFVENTGKEVILPFYSAYDRKKIHSFVSDHANPHIETKSV
jgi:predicted RNA-binding protein Jag